VKKFLLSLAAVGLALVAAARAPAQEDNKPLLVLSLPSVESLIKDIGYLGTVAGREGLEKIVEDAITDHAGGLKGLDRRKPIGLAASTDGGVGFQVLGFVPTSDAESLLSLLPPGAAPEDVGDGVKKIARLVGGKDAFLKSKGSWLYVSNEASSLAKLPDDPLKLLDGMDKQYDLGLRIFMQNIPPFFKGLAITGIQAGVKRGLARKPDESDEEFARREKLVKTQIDTIVKTINELDKITLGWSVDASAKKLVMEVTATATAGSDTAKRYAAQADVRSAFGGFWRDDAVFSALVTGKVTEEEAAQLTGTLAEGKKALLKEIDKSGDFENEAQKAKVKEVVGKLWDVFEGTIKSGQMDLGVTVLGEGPFTLAVGLGVADGAAADKALRDAIKIAEDEGVLKVEYDVEKADGLTFHRITPKLGDEAEKVGKVLGSDPKVILATGKKGLYLAVGSDAMKSLKDLIAKSKATGSRPAAPGQMVLSLAPIVKYVAKQDPLNPLLAKVAESIKPGSDRIRISSRLVPNGEATRIEVEEGVIKLIADGVMMYREARAAAEFGAIEKAVPARAKDLPEKK
jgi:hypothetical protein